MPYQMLLFFQCFIENGVLCVLCPPWDQLYDPESYCYGVLLLNYNSFDYIIRYYSFN